jgi:hypothetical protein
MTVDNHSDVVEGEHDGFLPTSSGDGHDDQHTPKPWALRRKPLAADTVNPKREASKTYPFIDVNEALAKTQLNSEEFLQQGEHAM